MERFHLPLNSISLCDKFINSLSGITLDECYILAQKAVFHFGCETIRFWRQRKVHAFYSASPENFDSADAPLR